MKKILLSFLLCSICLSNCTKTNNLESTNEEYNEAITVSGADKATSEIILSSAEELSIRKFVNAQAGLRVRNYPDLSAERIAVLENLTEIRVIREDGNTINIDGIEGKWTFIETGDIQGWVFGGYLTLEPISTRQAISIVDISDYIKRDINFTKRGSNYGIDDLFAGMNINGEFRIVSQKTYENIWGTYTDQYIIEWGDFRFIVSGTPNEQDRYIVWFEMEINEENYLHLFPHRTIDEYMNDRNFGDIYNSSFDGSTSSFGHYNELISYLDPIPETNSWELIFKNGILHSIIFGFYSP